MAEKKTTSAPPSSQRARSRADDVRERLHESEEHVKETFASVAEPVKARFEKPAAQVSRATRWVKAFKPYRVLHQLLAQRRKPARGRDGLPGAVRGLRRHLARLLGRGDLARRQRRTAPAIADIINRAIPGLIGPGGVIDPADLTSTTTTFGWTGVIAAISLLWTAISWFVLHATGRARDLRPVPGHDELRPPEGPRPRTGDRLRIRTGPLGQS